MNNTTSARRLIAAVGGALALATLTACGGGSVESSPSAPSTITPAASAAPDLVAYRDCMATNGVTLPAMGARPSGLPNDRPSGMPSGAPGGGFPGGAPGGLPDGADRATFDAAQTACQSLAPTGETGPGTVDATALAAFTSCLADHDVSMPTGADGIRRLDRSDPPVKAALDICGPLLPVLPAP